MRVTWQIGQVVQWAPSPNRLAQICELRRTRVRLFYCTRSGRERFPIVDAFHLAGSQDPRLDPPLPLMNVMGRAFVKAAQKTFSGEGQSRRRGPSPFHRGTAAEKEDFNGRERLLA